MKRTEKKRIARYLDGYILMLPVYYKHETAPAWRKSTQGDLATVREAYEIAPDYLEATAEENKKNREWKRREYIYLLDRGKRKQAEEIRAQYEL